jgi:hypothetical protein
VNVAADGTITAGKTLRRGQFLQSTVLSDELIRRQSVYRAAFETTHLNRRAFNTPTLLGWSPLLPTGLSINGEYANGSPVHAGSAFWSLGMQLERPASDSIVRIPPAFLKYRAVRGGRLRGIAPAFKNSTGIWHAASTSAKATLRFQIPRDLLPIQPVEATVRARLSAPAREVEFLAGVPGELASVEHWTSPIGTIEATIDVSDGLQCDTGGGVLVGIDIGEVQGDSASAEFGTQEQYWKIEWVEMDLKGKVE